ncbi:MAG: Crp/Fnr family transcriptional regulator [Marinoscillum sp.]|uniref:Crp/Fnr family transcriptional regulator n=1 Tax=Marinoscillum sp. TaxID=2024838 RepID=UPI0032F1A194
MESLFAHIEKVVALNEEERDLISKHFNPRKYLKGQFIVQQGDVCRFENFVVKGCLKTFHISASGQEHVVMFAIENWWTSDLGSFLMQTPAAYNVQCLEPTEVLQISLEALNRLYQEVPKMDRFFRIIIQNAYVASDQRIIQNFSIPAKERYLAFRRRYPEIEQRVPQYLIASYLGITKEFLSKIRNQLIYE